MARLLDDIVARLSILHFFAFSLVLSLLGCRLRRPIVPSFRRYDMTELLLQTSPLTRDNVYYVLSLARCVCECLCGVCLCSGYVVDIANKRFLVVPTTTMVKQCKFARRVPPRTHIFEYFWIIHKYFAGWWCVGTILDFGWRSFVFSPQGWNYVLLFASSTLRPLSQC